MNRAISLVLIEDNRLLREGIAALIRQQPDFRVLAASADVDEALQKVRGARPQVVLLDPWLQNHDSLRLMATVHSEIPEARIIVMGLLPLQEDIAGYVKAGASGFIMKDASLEDFLMTIRRVAEGADVLPPAADGVTLSAGRSAGGARRRRASAGGREVNAA